jgi:hypothetical protein
LIFQELRQAMKLSRAQQLSFGVTLLIFLHSTSRCIGSSSPLSRASGFPRDNSTVMSLALFESMSLFAAVAGLALFATGHVMWPETLPACSCHATIAIDPMIMTVMSCREADHEERVK